MIWGYGGAGLIKDKYRSCDMSLELEMVKKI